MVAVTLKPVSGFHFTQGWGALTDSFPHQGGRCGPVLHPSQLPRAWLRLQVDKLLFQFLRKTAVSRHLRFHWKVCPGSCLIIPTVVDGKSAFARNEEKAQPQSWHCCRQFWVSAEVGAGTSAFPGPTLTHVSQPAERPFSPGPKYTISPTSSEFLDDPSSPVPLEIFPNSMHFFCLFRKHLEGREWRVWAQVSIVNGPHLKVCLSRAGVAVAREGYPCSLWLTDLESWSHSAFVMLMGVGPRKSPWGLPESENRLRRVKVAAWSHL